MAPIDYNKNIVYEVLPKGATIFNRTCTVEEARVEGNKATYAPQVLTEDRSLVKDQAIHGNLSFIQHVIPDCHSLGYVSGDGWSYYDAVIVYDRKQREEQAMTWPDGTYIELGEYFEVTKGQEFLKYEREDWTPKLVTGTVPRKYTGKIEHCIQIPADAPDGRGAGFGISYTQGVIRVEDVVRTVAPVRKEKEEAGPNLRTLMVKDSKWKLTADLPLRKVKFTMVDKDNGRGHTYQEEEREPYVVDTLPKGSELTVLAKPEAIDSWSFSKHPLRGITGLAVHCSFELNGKSYHHQIVYKDLVGIVEQLEAGKVESAFYVYDTAEQKYYVGDGVYYDRNQHCWATLGIQYSPKGTSKAKKFKRLGDVRAFALNASGYYDGLPGAENLPDWVGGSKKFDIPETWVIHEIDKASKKVIREIELLDTFKRTWKLRGLTMKYGSAVRNIYSDLEKKGKLAEFSAVLVFTKKKDRDSYWWDYDLTPEETQEIEDSISTLDKKEIRKGKGDRQRAFAIKDVATGVMIRLMYSGSMEAALIDFEHMVEVAGDTPVGGSEIDDQIRD